MKSYFENLYLPSRIFWKPIRTIKQQQRAGCAARACFFSCWQSAAWLLRGAEAAAVSGLDHGEAPGFHGIGKCVAGRDDGCPRKRL